MLCTLYSLPHTILILRGPFSMAPTVRGFGFKFQLPKSYDKLKPQSIDL